jgi:flagellar motor switch/type III secretory pathway protein FliN
MGTMSGTLTLAYERAYGGFAQVPVKVSFRIGRTGMRLYPSDLGAA